MNKTKKVKCNCTGKCAECKCKSDSELKKGKTKNVAGIAILLFVLSAGICFGANSDLAKPGLLVISHGAPWPQWNQPVLDLEKDVIKELGEDNPFNKVKFVFMEFTEPSVADGIKELEEAGCSRIVAVPLMIAPSSHSHWDIPALLGLYSDSEMEKQLKEEGAKIVRSKLPITLTSTLADSGVIEKIMLKRTQELSKNPENEAVVLLAHGDHMVGNLWEDFMKKTTTYICGKTGISYGDWTYAEMGQSYDKAAAAISLAGKSRKRIIVIGAYLSMGVDSMHDRWLKQSSSMSESMPHPLPGSAVTESNPFDGLEIVLCKKGLLPDPLVGKWIADIAKQEANKK